jgi:methanogenic corrinoid protein MtbC1
MQRHLAEGLSAAEAARAALAVEASPPADRTPRVARLRDDLSEALARFDAIRAHALLDRLFAEIGVDAAMRDVIFPVLHDLGEAWVRAEVHVGQEHFASNLLQARLLALLRGADRGVGPLALLACPPGERHTLGLIGFGIALRNRGWQITYLGADTPIPSVQRAAADVAPTVVVLSSAMAMHFTEAEDQLRDLAAALPLALAGQGASRGFAQRVGAQLLDADPVTAADRISLPQARLPG